MSGLDFFVVAVAAFIAGGINSLAGGGTLISFPVLIAVGIPALPANITNTVSLCPGYFSGAIAQRDDLAPQKVRAKRLAISGLFGGVIGSVLLELTPNNDFHTAVPWLILISCALLLSQNRVRNWVNQRSETRTVTSPSSRVLRDPSLGSTVAVFAAAIYGGFFGAGLGIMLLGLLGLFSDDSLRRVNALKQVLSLVINVCAALIFAVSGNVRWQIVPIMALAALLGGYAGGRLTTVVNPTALRWTVVVFGLVVAVKFWIP
ncbi:MAG: sulfite exporter TauE/SafE family protein [Acidobacteria bacterium]|nr:sulfite exporter TauE/SafE family protein [Acidobacteriota bacterium]